VVEIKTSVPLFPGARPGNLFLEVQHADLMERTGLHHGRPSADLRGTIPGQSAALEAQIEAHRRFMGIDQKREVAIEEAGSAWYDTVYLPVVQALREGSALEAFPGQTETDVYLRIFRHRAALSDALGWEIRTQVAIADLVRQSSARSPIRVARVGKKLRESIRHDPLAAGQLPGTWRRENGGKPREDCLFADILVPISGEEGDWTAVAQAAELACREGARLMGVHVVPARDEIDGIRAQALQTEFARHCAVAGALGTLTIATGRSVGKVLERFRWADLVVMGLPYPSHGGWLARRMSLPRQLLRCWPTPVLVVPGALSPLSRPLLAFDGGRKAREALFFAANLAVQKQIPLTVASVEEDGVDVGAALSEARIYLERYGIGATFVEERGPAGKAILKTADAQESDLILMGGYGQFPLLDVLFGSVVDEVLRASRQPVLVCW
jgi:nucleotide-binding universal stress UspA family protein